MSPKPTPFDAIGRLPAPDDNVAIATRRLEAGTEIALGGNRFVLDFTVLVGHRFAIRTIAEGEPLLSWGVPFGIAIEPVLPGQTVCNDGMLEALAGRALDFDLPPRPNFRDEIVPFIVDETAFQPGKQIGLYAEARTFMGYRRSAGRGVGTRNMVVVLGTTSSTASYARALAERLASDVDNFANVDGVVPIAHTEGSGYEQINNRYFLLRTLAGLMVHPNVGAVLAVDLAADPINNGLLQEYMLHNGYPLDQVPHHFFSLTGDWKGDLGKGESLVRRWLPQANETSRTAESLAHLSIALQCGGSDAFSGVSGNPLASNVAKEVIRYGGRANLAETDELIGSEAYVLQNVRDLETARTFLDYIAAFKERLAWHGQSAEGNPSGGNKLRGLYNIALKSIGAAMKRHPDVRLDHVVDYSERMVEPGYYFMNTPGNDLESIAGQVAGGSNLIIFITGNGSITNFPFVPTIKVMTTTERFGLLSREMDVNAGAYLDGKTMEDLTAETLDLLVDIASGKPSKGELAGHSQISIWRNWQQRDRSRLPLILERVRPNGQAIPIRTNGESFSISSSKSQIGLILPTSLCSGQIARLAVDRLNMLNESTGLSRFATLVHTEGCGVAFASTREIYAETMVGYAVHPLVGACLFLEHGCEKAHNDYLHSLLVDRGLEREDFGWASVQLDGGIERVLGKIEGYFGEKQDTESTEEAQRARRNAREFSTVALVAEGDVPREVAVGLARVVQGVVGAGGSVVVPSKSTLPGSTRFLDTLGLLDEPEPSLAYGQRVQQQGFHLMETPTMHWSETVTGLGATGAEVIIGYSNLPRAGHPFVPLVQVGDSQSSTDFDLVLAGGSAAWPTQIVELISAVVNGEKEPKSLSQQNVDFQLTRGWLGIST